MPVCACELADGFVMQTLLKESFAGCADELVRSIVLYEVNGHECFAASGTLIRACARVVRVHMLVSVV